MGAYEPLSAGETEASAIDRGGTISLCPAGRWTEACLARERDCPRSECREQQAPGASAGDGDSQPWLIRRRGYAIQTLSPFHSRCMQCRPRPSELHQLSRCMPNCTPVHTAAHFPGRFSLAPSEFESDKRRRPPVQVTCVQVTCVHVHLSHLRHIRTGN